MSRQLTLKVKREVRERATPEDSNVPVCEGQGCNVIHNLGYHHEPPKGMGGSKRHYTKLDQTSSDIPPDMRWYGCAGTFMKLYEDGYSGYAEVAEYDPTEIGFLVLKVRGGKIVDLKKHYLKMA